MTIWLDIEKYNQPNRLRQIRFGHIVYEKRIFLSVKCHSPNMRSRAQLSILNDSITIFIQRRQSSCNGEGVYCPSDQSS